MSILPFPAGRLPVSIEPAAELVEAGDLLGQQNQRARDDESLLAAIPHLEQEEPLWQVIEYGLEQISRGWRLVAAARRRLVQLRLAAVTTQKPDDVIGELARELKMSKSALYREVQLAETYIDSGQAEPLLPEKTFYTLSLALDEPERAAALAWAADERAAGRRLTTRDYEAHVTRLKVQSAPDVEPPAARYPVLYCDPRWNPADGSQYDRLAKLPVAQVALSDSVLFLRTPAPTLDRALALLVAWGFQYRSVIAVEIEYAWEWDDYTSHEHDYLLIGGKGALRPEPERRTGSLCKAHEVRLLVACLMSELPILDICPSDETAQIPGKWTAWEHERMNP